MQGYTIEGILNLYINQFYYLLDCLSSEIEEMERERKKSKRRRK